MTTKLTDRISAGEAKYVRALIRAALKRGWAVSVDDGEEYVVKQSTREGDIIDGIAHVEMDRVLFRDGVKGPKVGVVVLIYGNDGVEVISDHSDNNAINALVEEVTK